VVSIEPLRAPDPSAPHHHRSEKLSEMPGLFIPITGLVGIASLILLLTVYAFSVDTSSRLADLDLEIIIALLAAIAVAGLSLRRIVPFFLAGSLVVAALFFATLTYSIRMTSPSLGTAACTTARITLPSSPNAPGHWEFGPPAGQTARGQFATQAFTVGDSWTITWRRDGGVMGVTLYDTVAERGGGYVSTFAKLSDREGVRDQPGPHTTSLDLSRPGTYCLSIDTSETSTSGAALPTDWHVTVDDHR
jgi:hypothetical protein